MVVILKDGADSKKVKNIFSLGDFIRRGRFYICLILGVVFITFVCLVVSLMPISIQ